MRMSSVPYHPRSAISAEALHQSCKNMGHSHSSEVNGAYWPKEKTKACM